MKKKHESWIIKEIKDVIPAIIYFCIAFNLIHFTVGLTMPPHAIRYYSYFTATLAGIILGKIMIIANAFSFFNIFNNYPLIVTVTWKMFFYALFIFAYHIIESVIKFIYHFGFHSEVLRLLLLELQTPVFWATQIWSYIFLFFFVVFAELISHLTKAQTKKIFFG